MRDRQYGRLRQYGQHDRFRKLAGLSVNGAGEAESQRPGSFSLVAPNRNRLLALTTEEDRGIVERPLLSPMLEARPLEGGAAVMLLVSETANLALHGQHYLDLIPLLDGTRSRFEITDALNGAYKPLEVQTALVSMASKGYIVSADFDMDTGSAAFWCSMRVSPRAAEERLRAARVALDGDEPGLAEALGAMGLAPAAGGAPTLTVIPTADYVHEGHAETNRRHLASGMPWMLVRANGMWPILGPVFRPVDGGPCWHCLSHRMRTNNEVENFLRTVAGDSRTIPPRVAAPPVADLVRGMAAAEIAKWVVLGEHAALHDNALTFDSFRLAIDRHPVRRRPQCPVCGDDALYRPDRESAPVVLRSNPKPVRNSGGLHCVPPEETVRRYRHLVSPVSGVVTQLARVTDEADPWLHVYWAGSNLALRANSLNLLRNSIRTKSSGKGSTREQAEASALCEALERYSGSFSGEEIRHRRRFEDFADGAAIHPNDIMRYSERQYDNAEAFNAIGSRFNYVPARFDPSTEMDWTPVWSLTHERTRYLPTSMLYFGKPHGPDEVLYCGPDSNGCAAGNTLEEAILQGFFELVERDAFACWWYNRIALPEVDLDSFDDPFLSRARDYYRSINRDMWVLDATNDIGIPAFITVSYRTDKASEDIIYSAGAHADPHIAALRAVCELNQYVSAVLTVDDDGEYTFDDPETLWWWQNAKLADHPYLAPDRAAALRGKADYPVRETEDVRDDVEHCRNLVESRGMEFLVLDQTRPDIGLPVAKTIVPGLRHFWARFAPGRLYDVPVALGWRETPTPEEELNPFLVFI